MRRAASLALALALALASCGTRPSLRAEGAWVRAAPAGAASAAYLVIVNDGASPLALTGARADAADSLSLHATERDGAMMRMREVPALAVPAHGRLRLEPGGAHLMLARVRSPLVAGQRMALTLRFGDGRALAIEAMVRD